MLHKCLSVVVLLLFSITSNVLAQRTLDFFQNGKVVQSIPISDVEQLRISNSKTSGRTIDIYRNGRKQSSFDAFNVDSIKIIRLSDEPYVYLGIVGFNKEVYEKQFGVLANSTEKIFNNYVNYLTSNSGSILYYAVDDALDMLSSTNFTTQVSSINLITFTDGLDQGSLMLNNKYDSESDYIDYLNARIASLRIAGVPLTAYSLGLRGIDVSDYNQFKFNLQKLASSGDNVSEVTTLNDVQKCLQEIADKIILVSSRQTMSVKIPGPSNATLIRFVLDGKSPGDSNCYIEGTFNLKDLTISNINYHGLNSSSGDIVQGIRDGIFITFTFNGLQINDGKGPFNTSDIMQYNLSPSSSSWQKNSEFSPNGDVQTTTIHNGCVIALVLDCSSSLGADFSRMKNYVNDFINKLSQVSADFIVGTPSNLSSTPKYVNGSLCVEVSWLPSKNAQSYTIYRSKNSSSEYTIVAENITSATWLDRNPYIGSNYYKIVAENSGVKSLQSTYSLADLSILPPTNLTAVVKEKDNKLQVELSWDKSEYAQSYTIYRSSTVSGGFYVVADCVNNTNWTDYTPSIGKNYYRVVAENSGVKSIQSNNSYVDVNVLLPTVVSAVLTKRNDSLQIDLSWSETEYVKSYAIYRSSTEEGKYNIIAEGLTSSYWTDISPLPGNNYYKIAVEGYAGDNIFSESVFLNVVLLPPSNVSAVLNKNGNKDQVILSWSSSEFADCYNIYRSSSPTSPFFLVSEDVKNTTWNDTAPLSTLNYYKIEACNKELKSVWSKIVLATEQSPDYYMVNGVQFAMVKVEGGMFKMGSSDGKYNESPVHDVVVNSYSIGQTEVTQELWSAVMGSNPSRKKGERLPVDQVTWDATQTFISRLHSLTGKIFRLPTEAEWEYAARGGCKSLSYRYSGCDEINEVAWYEANSEGNAKEVATLAPNELGIYDMSGNVREWCQDWYGDYSDKYSTNPLGPISGSSQVCRGGSVIDDKDFCRVSARNAGSEYSDQYSDVGLRLVLDDFGNSKNLVYYKNALKVGSFTARGACYMDESVRIHCNKDVVRGIKFAGSYKIDNELSDNVVTVTCDGGFLHGDTLKIAGVYNNPDEKVAKIHVFVLDENENITVLFETKPMVNGRISQKEPEIETFILEGDYEKLYLGRVGNTGTFVTNFAVTRDSSQ